MTLHIHADVILPPDREQGSETAEQQLHILLYQTDVPEAELNAALSDLRAQRRRKKPSIRAHSLRMCFRWS